MECSKGIRKIVKCIFWGFLGIVLFILIGIIGYSTFIVYKLKQDPQYFYEKPFSVQWQEMVNEYWEDVRNHEIPLEDVYGLIEQEGMTINEVDSMLGDSLWRVTGECEE